jgi:hypothetical protein
MQHSRLHEGRGTTFVPPRSQTPLSSTRRSPATLPSYRWPASFWSARVVTQGHAVLSSSRRSWHQRSSHEGRRHHCRLREGRRQSLRPIDGQPR